VSPPAGGAGRRLGGAIWVAPAIRLWGDPTADALACVTGIVFAATTATLRVMADRHYASDVIVGGAIGFSVGYGLPSLLNYRAPTVSVGATTVGIAPRVSASSAGLTALGVF
jgi:membrane-associated phospholipid phosphatase